MYALFLWTRQDTTKMLVGGYQTFKMRGQGKRIISNLKQKRFKKCFKLGGRERLCFKQFSNAI